MGNCGINILITCAGRRVELVNAFKRAVAAVGGGSVVAADCRHDAPALAFADAAAFLPPLSREDDYIGALVSAARACRATLVVPTIDTELPLLARNRGLIERESGARVVVSSEECVAICADKRRTADFFAENAIPCAETWKGRADVAAAGPDFPLVVKPARGSSSMDVFVAHDRRELDFFLDYVREPVVQRLLTGREYTVDALVDFNSHPVAAVPRQRLAVRAGEILKGRIDLEPRVLAASQRLLGLLADLGAIGPVTLQGFLCDDGEFRFTEVNPRFGGGAPMSFAAGADFALWLCRVSAGLPPQDLSSVRDGILFSRFDSTVEVQTPQGRTLT